MTANFSRLRLALLFTASIQLLQSCTPEPPLDQQLTEIAERNQLIGMSVLVVCDDGIIDEFYHGLADIAEERPIGPDTRYRIASISKTVVATGLMQLWERGKFRLDDDISPALGYRVRNPRFPEAPITYRMLLSHTSSLRDGSGYGDFLFTTYRKDTIPDMSEILLPGGAFYTEDVWMDKEPGTYFTYCNLAYGLIGALIEKLSGKRFDRYMKEQVLDPLGIRGSFNVRDVDELGTIATLYRNGQPTADNYRGVPPRALPDDYEIGRNGSIFGPQGSLRVSARELSRFMRLLMGYGEFDGARLLDSATVALMEKPVWINDGTNGKTFEETGEDFFNAYGLGLHRTGNPGHGDHVFQNVTMTGHAGEAYGLISQMHWTEDHRFGLILMTNGYYGETGHTPGESSAFYRAEEAVFGVVRSLLKNCQGR